MAPGLGYQGTSLRWGEGTGGGVRDAVSEEVIGIFRSWNKSHQETCRWSVRGGGRGSTDRDCDHSKTNSLKPLVRSERGSSCEVSTIGNDEILEENSDEDDKDENGIR